MTNSCHRYNNDNKESTRLTRRRQESDNRMKYRTPSSSSDEENTSYRRTSQNDRSMSQRRERSHSLNSSFSSSDDDSYLYIEEKTKNRSSRIKECLIFDTNAIIDYPDLIEQCCENRILTVVPYTVVEEMNNLKFTKRNLAYRLNRASRYIDELASEENKYLELESASEKWREFENFKEQKNDSDDYILKCALRVKTQFRSDYDNNDINVCLVTGDRILRVKARSNNLKVRGVEDILKKYDFYPRRFYRNNRSYRDKREYTYRRQYSSRSSRSLSDTEYTRREEHQKTNVNNRSRRCRR